MIDEINFVKFNKRSINFKKSYAKYGWKYSVTSNNSNNNYLHYLTQVERYGQWRSQGGQGGAEPPPERFEPPLESFETRIEIRKSYVMSTF
jgi:hypothetical protein